MFLVLWEFDVKPGSEEVFERIYGPTGDWARFFRRDRGYQSTCLLRDPVRPQTYLTCDYWESREAYEALSVRNHSDAYLALDQKCEKLTTAERKIGAFEQVAEDYS